MHKEDNPHHNHFHTKSHSMLRDHLQREKYSAIKHIGINMTRIVRKSVKFVIHNKYKIPCQNGYKNDLTAIQQHQKPNKSHNDPDLKNKNK